MSALSDEERAAFARVGRERFGLHFPPSRTAALEQGAREAAARLHLPTGTLLARARAGDAAALAALADTLTVGETYFLRDPQHFALLREVLAHATRRVTLWSAGCASGAEPFSMAVEALKAYGPEAPSRARVIGTDISEEALAAARLGVYRPWAFRGTSVAFRERWFERVDGAWRVRDEVRRLVTFRWHNLLGPWDATWPSHVDVIFCRNVLVYFDDDAVAHAVEGMCRALASDGILVTGPSDPLLTRWGLVIEPSAGFVAYRRPTPPPMPGPARRPTPEAPLKAPPQGPAPATPAPPEREVRTAAARAREHADRGDTAGALALLEQALREDPLDARAYLLRAQLAQASGQHQRALEDARRALFLDRELVFAHLVLAPSAWALGRRDTARQALRNAREALSRMDPGTRVAGAGAAASELLGALKQMELGFDRREHG